MLFSSLIITGLPFVPVMGRHERRDEGGAPKHFSASSSSDSCRKELFGPFSAGKIGYIFVLLHLCLNREEK